jgi:hypothetical protein
VYQLEFVPHPEQALSHSDDTETAISLPPILQATMAGPEITDPVHLSSRVCDPRSVDQSRGPTATLLSALSTI